MRKVCFALCILYFVWFSVYCVAASNPLDPVLHLTFGMLWAMVTCIVSEILYAGSK
jgi:hypothetical protein